MKKPPGQIVTFYSYKGGTGRSLCLANVAVRLANTHDKNVIVIDWDLDAPGQHRYFQLSRRSLIRKPGLIDYLEDYQSAYNKLEEHPNPRLKPYLFNPGKAIKEQLKYGKVRIMTAGKFDADFRKRVGKFDWDKFFEDDDGAEAFKVFREQLTEAADLVLIDARAGVTDQSSVPLLSMPDRLFLFFGANKQDMDGTMSILRLLVKAREEKVTPLREGGVLLIPSRIPVREMPKEYKAWCKKADKEILEFTNKNKLTSPLQYDSGIDTWTLEYLVKYSFCEESIQQKPRQKYDILDKKYAALTRVLSTGVERIPTTNPPS